MIATLNADELYRLTCVRFELGLYAVRGPSHYEDICIYVLPRDAHHVVSNGMP